MNARSCLLLLVALTLAAPYAAADFRSAPYVGGSPMGGLGVQCNTGCFPNGPSVNIGGYEFAPNGQTPTWVHVMDGAGVGVFATACQDADDNGLCGEPGEPMATGCGDGMELKNFQAVLPTLVFVYSTQVIGGTCVGLATTGFITLVTGH